MSRPYVYDHVSPSMGPESDWPRGRPRFWFVYVQRLDAPSDTPVVRRRGPFPWRWAATRVGMRADRRWPGCVTVERAYLTRSDIAFILIYPFYVLAIAWLTGALI